MTEEQLNKGNRLKSSIDELRKRIAEWEKVEGIHGIELFYKVMYPAGIHYVSDNGSFVNFEVLKTLALNSMRQKLEELEKEYREL